MEFSLDTRYILRTVVFAFTVVAVVTAWLYSHFCVVNVNTYFSKSYNVLYINEVSTAFVNSSAIRERLYKHFDNNSYDAVIVSSNAFANVELQHILTDVPDVYVVNNTAFELKDTELQVTETGGDVELCDGLSVQVFDDYVQVHVSDKTYKHHTYHNMYGEYMCVQFLSKVGGN